MYFNLSFSIEKWLILFYLKYNTLNGIDSIYSDVSTLLIIHIILICLWSVEAMIMKLLKWKFSGKFDLLSEKLFVGLFLESVSFNFNNFAWNKSLEQICIMNSVLHSVKIAFCTSTSLWIENFDLYPYWKTLVFWKFEKCL